MVEPDMIDEAVRKHYADAARRADACCGPVVSGDEAKVFGAGQYDPDDLEALPAGATELSIGCANPVALADLAAGEVVLDLGSGGGIDVFLSARRVGPTGKAYGLDMTDEMLEAARANQTEAGVENVEFLKGRIEDIPLPDQSVDVVISNCVINLSTDKAAVFAEAFRVLRPGGRLAVADVAADQEVDQTGRADLAAWVDCLAGAQTRSAYQASLEAAGFNDVSISDSHAVAKGFTSVLIRARRPRRLGE
jgi:SAM-dependent methyltransferase